jgi:hypothetical protein
MASIPMYRYDRALLDFVGERAALRLEAEGRATLVRHKKTGTINRVILLKRESDPRALALRDYQGRAYSFNQPLDDGHHAWKLRPLHGGKSDLNLAPEHVRPIFLRVLLDCIVPAA